MFLDTELMSAAGICQLIDAELTNFIHNIIVVIKIGVPLLLVIFGMLDFVKGVIGGNDDEIKKGQKSFIKRLIAGIVVFFIVAIAQFAISLTEGSDSEIWKCASAIMNGTNETKDNNTNNQNKYEITEEKKQCCNYANGVLNSNGYCVAPEGDSDKASRFNYDSYNNCMKSVEAEKNETTPIGISCDKYAKPQYDKCMEYHNDEKLCNTIFQTRCSGFDKSSLLWSYRSMDNIEQMEPEMKNIDCTITDSGGAQNYKAGVYSCSFGSGYTLETCVSLFYPFCNYKSSQESKKVECCSYANGVMNSKGECTAYNGTTEKFNYDAYNNCVNH